MHKFCKSLRANQHPITFPLSITIHYYRGCVGRRKGQGRPEQASVAAWGPCELARGCAELGLTGCALTLPSGSRDHISSKSKFPLAQTVAVPSTNQLILHSRKAVGRDLPGDPVVKNLHCNARQAGSFPGQGTKIPLATGAIKPVCHN